MASLSYFLDQRPVLLFIVCCVAQRVRFVILLGKAYRLWAAACAIIDLTLNLSPSGEGSCRTKPRFYKSLLLLSAAYLSGGCASANSPSGVWGLQRFHLYGFFFCTVVELNSFLRFFRIHAAQYNLFRFFTGYIQQHFCIVVAHIG